MATTQLYIFINNFNELLKWQYHHWVILDKWCLQKRKRGQTNESRVVLQHPFSICITLSDTCLKKISLQHNVPFTTPVKAGLVSYFKYFIATSQGELHKR